MASACPSDVEATSTDTNGVLASRDQVTGLAVTSPRPVDVDARLVRNYAAPDGPHRATPAPPRAGGNPAMKLGIRKGVALGEPRRDRGGATRMRDSADAHGSP